MEDVGLAWRNGVKGKSKTKSKKSKTKNKKQKLTTLQFASVTSKCFLMPAPPGAEARGSGHGSRLKAAEVRFLARVEWARKQTFGFNKPNCRVARNKSKKQIQEQSQKQRAFTTKAQGSTT